MSEQQDKRVPLENIVNAQSAPNVSRVITSKFIGIHSRIVTEHLHYMNPSLGDDEQFIILNEEEWREIGKEAGWKMRD